MPPLKTDNQYLREEYKARVNRALDYIEQNLDKELRLDAVAEVANFSPYHFHRIFGGVVGEPLNKFIARVRAEKAAFFLTEHKKKNLTEIAFDCGYSSSAAFSRAFKDYFGMSPSQWRAGGYVPDSKIRKNNSKTSKTPGKIRKDYARHLEYIANVIVTQVELNKWRIEVKTQSNLKAEVEVVDMPELNIVYVRHIGPYKGDGELFGSLFGKLCSWAGPRGLLSENAQFVSVYHDNPDLTDEDKLRVSVGVSAPEGTKTDGEIGSMKLPDGKYARARFRIDQDQYEAAWQSVFGGWLPTSGFQPEDSPAFEMYLNDPNSDPEGKHEFYICIPVKPL